MWLRGGGIVCKRWPNKLHGPMHYKIGIDDSYSLLLLRIN